MEDLFTTWRVEEYSDRTTRIYGAADILGIRDLRDLTELLLGREGEILPYLGPDQLIAEVSTETWFLPSRLMPSSEYCNDERIHHAYFAYRNSWKRDQAVQVVDGVEEHVIDLVNDLPVWPPPQQLINPPVGLFQGDPDRTVVEDYYNCNHVLDFTGPTIPPKPPYCGDLEQPGPYDFYRLLEGAELHVDEYVSAEMLDARLASYFEGFPYNFSGFQVTSRGRYDVIAWVDATRAGSAGQINDEFQIMVPRWEVYAGETTTMVTVMVSESEPYVDGMGFEHYFVISLPPFWFQFDSLLTFRSGRSAAELAAGDYPGNQDALDVEIDWVRLRRANVHPLFADDAMTHLEIDQINLYQVATPEQLKEAIITEWVDPDAEGYDEVAPDIIPQAIMEKMYSESEHYWLGDLADDLEKMLPHYTTYVNPLMGERYVVPGSERFVGIGPAQPSRAYTEESDCPAGVGVLPPVIDRTPLHTYDDAGMVLYTTVEAAVTPVFSDHDDLRARSVWLALDSADIAAVPVFDELQDLDDPNNPIRMQDADIAGYLMDVVRNGTDLYLGSLFDKPCALSWQAVYDAQIDECDTLCNCEGDGDCDYAPDLGDEEVMEQHCTDGCEEYLAAVVDQYGWLCTGFDWTFRDEVALPQPLQDIEVCGTVLPDFRDTLIQDWDGDGHEWSLHSPANDTRVAVSAPAQSQGCEGGPGGPGGCEGTTHSQACAAGEPLGQYSIPIVEPDPYLAQAEDGDIEVHVPIWVDLELDVVFEMWFDFDLAPDADPEYCPEVSLIGLPGNFLPWGAISVPGKLQVELTYEWVFPLHTTRRGQWSGGWRGENANPTTGVSLEVFQDITNVDEINATMALVDAFQDSTQTGLRLSLDNTCIEVDADDIEIAVLNPRPLPFPDPVDAISTIIETYITEQFADPCDNRFVNFIHNQRISGALTKPITIPFFEGDFYEPLWTNNGLNYEEQRRSLLATAFMAPSAGWTDLNLVEFLVDPTIRAVMRKQSLEQTLMGLTGALEPGVMLADPRADSIKALWDSELCPDVAEWGGDLDRCDDALLGVLTHDIVLDPGEHDPGFSGSLTPSSTGGAYLMLYEPENQHIPSLTNGGDWDPDNPSVYGLGVSYLEDDVDHQNLPYWEPGRPCDYGTCY